MILMYGHSCTKNIYIPHNNAKSYLNCNPDPYLNLLQSIRDQRHKCVNCPAIHFLLTQIITCGTWATVEHGDLGS